MQPSEVVLNPIGLLNSLNQPSLSENSLGDINVAVELHPRTKECWICYDRDKKDALINPCLCKGDVSSVHHECLTRWLMQDATKNKIARCEICKCEYNIICSDGKVNWKNGFTVNQRSIIVIVATYMCVTVAGCWTLIYFYNNSYVQILGATIGFLVIFVGFRFLGQNILQVYQRAKVATLNIASLNIDNNKT